MLNGALVSMLKQEFSDWSSEAITSLINEVQRIVFTQNATAQMRMYDSSTGNDPVLTTETGKYEYTIDTDNGFESTAWRIYDVYASDPEEPEDVMCFEATPESGGAKIVFKNNPGDNEYFIVGYRLPTQITNKSIQLEIPHAYHLTHVYQGVAGLIEQMRSGTSKRWDTFYTILLPDLVKKMSDGRRRSNGTPYRTCGV